MKTGEKIMSRYKREIIPPHNENYLEAIQSIQTHFLPDVKKPDPPVKSPVLRTSDIS